MKLISMSVWGDQSMYWEGALINACIYRQIYPGWQLRIYTDTENQHTDEIRRYGCDIRIMENRGGIHGMFWRFLPVSEQGVEAVIVRDADSRLNTREAVAVDAWLASGKAAHVMRDHPHHLNWPMLGGMWGIRGNVILDMEERIAQWGVWSKKLDDMHFLAKVIWPLIASDCLQHTRGQSPFGGVSFPPHSPCDCDYVGQVYYEGNQKDTGRAVQQGKAQAIPVPQSKPLAVSSQTTLTIPAAIKKSEELLVDLKRLSEQVLSLTSQVLRIKPEDPDSMMLAARAFFASHKPIEALQLAEAALMRRGSPEFQTEVERIRTFLEQLARPIAPSDLGVLAASLEQSQVNTTPLGVGIRK